MGYRIKIAVISVAVILALALAPIDVRADIIAWQYEDDFSTTKATGDSYSHSIFWPEMALLPGEPYLYYTSAIPPEGMLGLAGYYQTEEDAFLAYAFPVDNVLTRVDSGIFELDILLPDYSEPLPPPILFASLHFI